MHMQPTGHAKRGLSSPQPVTTIICMWVFVLINSVGCGGAPPPAPKYYDNLMALLFRTMDTQSGTEAQPELSNALIGLSTWLQDPAQRRNAENGFSVQSLDPVTLAMMGTKEPKLAGISVLTKSAHSVAEIAHLLTWSNFQRVVANDYDVYQMNFEQNPACFENNSCFLIRAQTKEASEWGGLVHIEFDYTSEFRWVDTPLGLMMLERFWLQKPASGSCCGVSMRSNCYVGVTMPDPENPTTHSYRVHANWFDVDLGAFGLFVGNPADRVVGTTESEAADVDDWLNTHPISTGTAAIGQVH